MRKPSVAGIIQNTLMRRIAMVAGGNTLAQLVTIAFAPIITRIYSPEQYGIQGVFLAAISVLSPIVAFRYPMAIVIAEDEQEAFRVRRLSLLVAGANSFVLGLIIVLAPEQLLSRLGLAELGWLVLLLPIAVLLTACQEIAVYGAIRANQFRSLSMVATVHALLLNGSRAIAGRFSPTGVTLAVISTFGPGLYAAMLSLRRRKVPADEKPGKGDMSWKALLREAKSRKDFPLLRTPTDLIYAAGQGAPVILLSSSFGTAVAGWFTLALTAMTLPSNVVGGAVGNVLYSHYAERWRQREPVFRGALKSTLLLVGPGAVLILGSMFAPALFGFFFGQEWREAGEYVRWLAIPTTVIFAQVPAVRLAPVIGRQDFLLVGNIIALAVSLGAVFVSATIWGEPQASVAAFAVSSAVCNLILGLGLLIAAKRADGANQESP
ncbi:lipopolysaccharide biosynthesis protein [Corynebacterium guangdongense]|uniref:O-antigen/teichoic acid export membrane protein n=1 Tax=Corynebacterium guangdongense TaxID=1783348 RepID=A0ABU1ZYT1_9CORY|nr:lipopolysaccharide biosynthesis protein [Corynebacterium guangdongense]MDR7329915.1 O-antigen/teichoic acid export membrane protein [Corynebacterium guangdongense]WJZ18473.1 hypothetical protein CGUA_09590 [Corynebacterium guangdongense]